MTMRKLSDFTAEALGALPRDHTIFVFTLGTIEDHGPHLTEGLDLVEASLLAESVAERFQSVHAGWEMILAGSAPLSIDSSTRGSALRVRAHVVRDYLVDSATSLARFGFRHFIVYSGTPGNRQLTAIEEAGKVLRSKHSFFGWKKKGAPVMASMNSVTIDDAQTSQSPWRFRPREHGGARDTSVALFAQEKGLTVVDPRAAALPHQERAQSGYWGDPSKASVETGRKLITEKVEALVPKIKARTEGSNPNHLFRAWYSVYPTNKSFFPLWVLTFMMLIVMGLLISMQLRAFLGGAEF